MVKSEKTGGASVAGAVVVPMRVDASKDGRCIREGAELPLPMLPPVAAASAFAFTTLGPLFLDSCLLFRPADVVEAPMTKDEKCVCNFGSQRGVSALTRVCLPKAR
jgi:hypothetical protein